MSDRGGDGEGEDEARQPICLDERGERINVREFLRVIVDDTDAEMAADRGGCAYYLRCQKVEGYEDGTCSFGCRDEPECITCEPAGGWPSSDPDYDYRAAWTDSFIGALFANALVHVDLGIPAPPSPLSLVWRRLADEWPEDEEWVWIARTNGRQPVWLGQVDGDSIVNGVAFLRRWNEELNGLRCWLPASVPAPPAAVPTPPAPEGETTGEVLRGNVGCRHPMCPEHGEGPPMPGDEHYARLAPPAAPETEGGQPG